jgi:hypothetical protein
LPPRRPGFKPGSGHVRFCDGQKWRWGRLSPRTSVSPANLRSICFSTIIFTVTRGWHNRPGVAAVPIASQTRIKKNIRKSTILIIGLRTEVRTKDFSNTTQEIKALNREFLCIYTNVRNNKFVRSLFSVKCSLGNLWRSRSVIVCSDQLSVFPTGAHWQWCSCA